jgi:hypothetical protein
MERTNGWDIERDLCSDLKELARYATQCFPHSDICVALNFWHLSYPNRIDEYHKIELYVVGQPYLYFGTIDQAFLFLKGREILMKKFD